MSVDLTQFEAGDDILVTVRATVEIDGGLYLARIQANRHAVMLDTAVSAEHVTPEIHAGAYYTDGARRLYIGLPNGRLRGNLGAFEPAEYGPTEVILIRGLRPAEVRPVVPA